MAPRPGSKSAAVAAKRKPGDREGESQPSGEAPGFEEQLRRLELLVERMEGEDLPLESAISLFEEGMALSRGLLERLEKAEKRVELLVKRGRGEVSREELDAGQVLKGAAIGAGTAGDDGDSGEDDDSSNG